MVRIRRGLAVAGVLSVFFWLVLSQSSTLDAQGGAPEILAMSGFGEPSGPVTSSHLRMNQPLYLLDLMRQVKAGTLTPQAVAPLVGGDSVLTALLARDLDSLLNRLTAPEDVAPVARPSTWRRVLTDDGVAPAPIEPVPPVQFPAVAPGDAAAQMLRITSPIDGVIAASLPAGSPFRVAAMRTEDGVTDHTVPMWRGDVATDIPALLRWLGGPLRRPQLERTQLPWTIPVRAGQDVQIELGLIPGVSVPGSGLQSELTISDAAGSGAVLWSVSMAALPLDSNIFVYVYGANLKPLQLTSPVLVESQQTFAVPMIVANPFPPALVQGQVALVAGPAGLSMTPVSFTLQPNGQVLLAPVLSVTSGSPAATTFVSQPFSLRVSYHDVPIQNAGARTFDLHYTVYPDSGYWQTNASAQGVNCFRNITVFASGKYASYGQCTNGNFYQAVVTETSSLGSIGIVSNDKNYYQANTVKSGWSSGLFNASSYPTVLQQKLAATWSVCTPAFIFC